LSWWIFIVSRLVVLVVVDLHRFRIDVRLQGVVGVGQLRQGEALGLLVVGQHGEGGQGQRGGAGAGAAEEVAARQVVHCVSPWV
jgi:hypothetical protein